MALLLAKYWEELNVRCFSKPGISFGCRLIVVVLAMLLSQASIAQSDSDSEPSEAPAQTKAEKLKELKKTTGLKGKKLREHLKLLQDSPPVDDEALQAYVTKIGNRILAQSEHAHLPYRFIVRDTEVVNAFVTGTPYVYVERGLLSLLNSEAELAAVMAHEIGHNVARHSARLQARNRRSLFLGTLASIVVGNSGVGNAIQTQGTYSLLEYKRDAELEADSFAARYLFGAGYEPSQLVNALAQLRDNNIFAASSTNRELPHHGLLTSHPRSDIRLRGAIEDAGVFPPGEAYIGRDEYREAIDGMVYGTNFARNAPDGLRRYSNETLGITFLHPKDWSRVIKGSKIILKDPEKTVQLKINIEKIVDKKQSSEDALKAKFPNVVNTEKIHKESQRDLGTIGAIPGERVALARVARNAFHFQGIAKNSKVSPQQDADFVEIIRSFRRMNPKDRTTGYVTKVYYERLAPGESFASLAVDFEDELEDAEAELRVLNGYYPKGEAEPGTWIKKLRREKIDQ